MNNDETSNDVVAINSDDEDLSPNSDKPIIQLFKRLITNDSKENTVLTNAQIVDILKKEFNINILTLHELEGDIYLTIMKKYLKDWPQWDELDRIIYSLKSKNKNADINKTLETNYVNLKNYLRNMLDSSRDLVKMTVQKFLNEKNKSTKDEEAADKTLVLEIRASRNQLNQLFFRHPHPDLNDTVFNPTFPAPTQIQLDTLPLEAILNWWGVNISVVNPKRNMTLYKRGIVHELKHVLVNKNLKPRPKPSNILDQDLKILFAKNVASDVKEYLNIFGNLILESPNNKEIYNFIKKDIKMLPRKIFARSTYQRYMNKYTYVRYLFKNVETSSEIDLKKYDLQLEETLMPMYHVQLGHVNNQCKVLIVDCGPCGVKFKGENIVADLKAHFEEVHNSEPDWKCSNCDETFQMGSLAANWWCHRC